MSTAFNAIPNLVTSLKYAPPPGVSARKAASPFLTRSRAALIVSRDAPSAQSGANTTWMSALRQAGFRATESGLAVLTAPPATMLTTGKRYVGILVDRLLESNVGNS